MAKIQIQIQVSILTIFILCFSLSPSISSSITVHELLKKKGLPAGLLPKEVKSYEFNDENGLLEVFLDGPCLTKFENRVLFESVVRANLTYGELMGVEGLTQEELFIWLPVKEITVFDPKSGIILFDIGMAQKQLSLSLFEDPPSCKQQDELIKYSGRKDKGFGAER
ncbi:uncharacterized protein At5g01610-like [Amaranthus tricolor]|uniref:uncharacterized protein At5g01610-like n=1 Tax=Amaranthus tricolor TaxID=29722 RepID=UPI00258FECD5|nr:uncharacterized protein At5g01610-like [Amaranthus tricolor]